MTKRIGFERITNGDEDLPDELRHLLGADVRRLAIGSQAEIADLVIAKLRDKHPDGLVADEGAIWGWAASHWRLITEGQIAKAVLAFDGSIYPTDRGEGTLKISANFVAGAGRLVHTKLATDGEQGGFFSWDRRGGAGKASLASMMADGAPIGVNCANGFARISPTGDVCLEAHAPGQRCRHVLSGEWRRYDERQLHGSLLGRLLSGTFFEDPDATEKVALLQEIAGVAATGISTMLVNPLAFVLYGPSAENGKGQILALLRGLLPADAVCSVAPRRWRDDKHVVRLRGKLLNTAGELSVDSIQADSFKEVVTGDDRIAARDVYKSAVEFFSSALHVFGANVLPPFRGGMDRGVKRRLAVIPCLRTIPVHERVADLGPLILSQEADLVLSWAVEGARRVIGRGGRHEVPRCCLAAVEDWAGDADPVLGWLTEAVDDDPHGRFDSWTGSELYQHFCGWGEREGYRVRDRDWVGPKEFIQRVVATGRATQRRTAGRRGYVGLAPRELW